MTTLEILFVLGAVGALPAVLLLALRGRVQESWSMAAVLAAGFIIFSAFPIVQDGVLGFLPNHTQDLWGTQVWYDLVIVVVVALVFIVPRARAVGMNVPLWVLAVGMTASISLLPMVARLFWLEKRARAEA
ncbi:hypothetical protein [Erythrobacter sp.]|jgi:hypothetical protein|uniref:hypothetical protein n=1 Tax=Erythrobacteraceae TaxID=335929 RepID=UPI001B095182|nr:hypothetical protein [Erythrobacter sp.]MBO6525918.1 hypothetical protein [Erythrobacter sp.]MBO6529407.1 hypothetical protein [Erythrobacter sp.]MBO6769653.1 hypothetical protein [Erythrobacter sp.]